MVEIVQVYTGTLWEENHEIYIFSETLINFSKKFLVKLLLIIILENWCEEEKLWTF